MAQVDRISGLIGNLGLKPPCNCATTGPITLSGEQTVDEYVCTAADNGGLGARVLVKDQANPVDNGIWYCNAETWQRAPDWDDPRDVAQGTQVLVVGGTVNGGETFQILSANPITPGVSSVTLGLSTQTGAIRGIPSVAALKSLSTPTVPLIFIVGGYAALGDGGGGFYWWNAADNTADNGGTILQLNAGGAGRFNKLW